MKPVCHNRRTNNKVYFCSSLYSIVFYFVLRNHAVKRRKGLLLAADSPQNDTIEVGPGNLKMSFSRTTGQLKQMYNSRIGVCFTPVNESKNFRYRC